MGLLSFPPTRRIGAWRKAAIADAGFAPPTDEIMTVRRFMHWEAVVFILIPIFAALMARGYGAL
jgi:putative membrane protein